MQADRTFDYVLVYTQESAVLFPEHAYFWEAGRGVRMTGMI